MSIIKHIPNSITSMNLLCGSIGVTVCCFDGNFKLAFILMLSAAVFDFLDGFSARLLGAYSPMGKELDSLADMVSFGVLPSVMLVGIMREYSLEESWISFTPLIIAVFSGLRLAKFNIDERQHSSFLGLATPSCAILCGALAYYVAIEPGSFLAVWCCGLWFIPCLSVVLSALLVCEIPMFSMKFGKDDPQSLKIKRFSFIAESVIIGILCFVLHWNWSVAPLCIFTLYILKNIIYKIIKV